VALTEAVFLPALVNQITKIKKIRSPSMSAPSPSWVRQAHRRVLPPHRRPIAAHRHGGVGAPPGEAMSGPCSPDPVSTTPDRARGGGGSATGRLRAVPPPLEGETARQARGIASAPAGGRERAPCAVTARWPQRRKQGEGPPPLAGQPCSHAVAAHRPLTPQGRGGARPPSLTSGDR